MNSKNILNTHKGETKAQKNQYDWSIYGFGLMLFYKKSTWVSQDLFHVFYFFLQILMRISLTLHSVAVAQQLHKSTRVYMYKWKLH